MTKKSAENGGIQLSRPLALVGMMGVGKTAIGKTLAKRLKLPFYDSDKVIQEKSGLTINAIFEDFGEPEFRAVEKKAIAGLLDLGFGVIATGGGAVLAPETMEILRQKAVMIWLDCDFEVLWDRLKHQKNRPLLKTENPQKRLKELLAQRRPLYEQAHIHVTFGDDNKTEVTDKVIKALSEFMNNASF